MASADAVLSTNLANAVNNDLDFTARTPGLGGNLISVTYVDPGAPSQALAVTVSGNDITVSLATNGSSVITTIASAVAAAIAANADANRLVVVTNKAANDGTGLVAAMAKSYLTAGAWDGTTGGYGDQDDMEDDRWKYVGESPSGTFKAETIVDGCVVQHSAASLNALLKSAASYPEHLGRRALAGLRRGPAAD